MTLCSFSHKSIIRVRHQCHVRRPGVQLVFQFIPSFSLGSGFCAGHTSGFTLNLGNLDTVMLEHVRQISFRKILMLQSKYCAVYLGSLLRGSTHTPNCSHVCVNITINVNDY